MSLIDLSQAVIKLINSEPSKIIISNPKSKDASVFIKIIISLKEISGSITYQAEKYTEKQVFHENFEISLLEDKLIEYLKIGYKQINAYGNGLETEIKINKKNDCLYKEVKASQDNVCKMMPSSNNRKKNYLLNEGMDIPVFRELGIFTKDFKVVNSKYDKFKQINRFTELVDDVIKDYHKTSINIIDFGCGKSYLTFILYYYLTEIRGIDANIIGLDLKADVIMKCNELARRFNYHNLKFMIGDINGFKAPFDVDMVVTLHACDTATDYALYNAIKWNADIILSVPCCQHEVNKQIKSDKLSLLTKYGIIKERAAALITDAIRGSMLEYSGYKTDVMEFIDIEHSPKNILIRAVKSNVSNAKRKDALSEALRLADEFSISQTLMNKLLSEDL